MSIIQSMVLAEDERNQRILAMKVKICGWP